MNDFEYNIEGEGVTISIYSEDVLLRSIKTEKHDVLVELGARFFDAYDDRYFTFETYQIKHPSSDDSYIYNEYDITRDDIIDYLRITKI